MSHIQDLDWYRQRLAAIADEIRTTPADDLKAKHDLAVEGDTWRSLLRSGNAKELAKARKLWTERAANKGSHEQDVAGLEGRAQSMGGEGGVS